MKRCYSLLDASSKRNRASDRVKNVPTLESSISPIKSRNKNITINAVTLFTNIIYLSLLLYTFQGSLDYRDVNKFSTKCTKGFNGKATGTTFKRNLAEEYSDNVPEVPEENVLEPEVATTPTSDFYTYEHPDEEDELDDIENLDEVIVSCEKEFNDILIDITNRFVEFTEDMNHYWCDHMWKSVWCKYVNIVHTDLMKDLNDPTLSLHEKKEIFKSLMEWCEEDFKNFLKLIKKEWDLRDDPEHYLER
ncbi:hypothetical protein PCYB_127910 [Plasmodium cynomolgi strain B]|uniref:Uncharacterized protein n=1 Tax=Plasmodium cynomolgi (strain B) TaxID=1120755 RepID=K6UEE8_PLACD|nr:hypothetical protein PCYB_127910 [Plasmodium cynomolgi strain B]GAB68226.1 hypothetical protein PCYB_127910 [Plasmodium cynomolgi strain B]